MKRINSLLFDESSRLFPILVIFLLAFTIRMVYLYEIHDSPFFYNLLLDETAYDEWGQRIAAGDWLGKDVFYQDPLYPYFLGAIYSVIGRDMVWVRIIQLFIGAGTCALIYLLGNSFFDRRTGLVAGVVAALYRPFFYFEALFLKTFLAIFLLCLFLLLLKAARSRRSLFLWIAAGLMLGLLSLARSNSLLLAGGVIIWLFAIRDGKESLKYALTATACFMAGLVLLVSVVCVRNYVVGKDFVLLTSQAGQNFFIGNNPWNKTGRYDPPILIRPNPKYERSDFHVRAEVMKERKLKPSEASAYWFGRGIEFIRENPRDWLRLMWTKSRLFWNWYEVPDNQSYYFFKQYSSLLRAPLPDFRIVAALGLCGMILCAPQWRKASLLYFVALIYSATVIAFYLFSRYRLPVVVPLILFAALTLTSAWTMVKEKGYFGLGATTLFVAIFLALLSTHVNPADYESDESNAYCRLGGVLIKRGQYPEAAAAYKRAIEIAPYYWGAHFGLGEVYETLAEPELAVASYEKSKVFNPGNADVYTHLGRIYFEEGRLEESAEQYRSALLLNPDWIKPHRRLARIYTLQGNHERAQLHLEKLRELGADQL